MATSPSICATTYEAVARCLFPLGRQGKPLPKPAIVLTIAVRELRDAWAEIAGMQAAPDQQAEASRVFTPMGTAMKPGAAPKGVLRRA